MDSLCFEMGDRRTEHPKLSIKENLSSFCFGDNWVYMISFTCRRSIFTSLIISDNSFYQYNLRFYKYIECKDKCKSLYFIVLHTRVVPSIFSLFVECPLSATMY